MKIVKPATFSGSTTKYFVCRHCGCEFLADSSEYREMLHRDTLRPVCHCPNCNLLAESSKNKLAQYLLGEMAD